MTEHLSADEIVQAIREHGSIVQAAKHFGVNDKSLDSRVTKLGVRDRVKAARLEWRLEQQSNKPEPERVEETVSEADLLRARNKELEKAHKKQRAALVEEERVIQRLEAAFPHARAKYVPPRARKRTTNDPHEAVLLFSDTHAGETVSLEETLGMNTYDWDVMLKRMARLQDSVLSFAAHRPYPISKLHVWFLGDMLSGSIHEELAQTNEMADAQATVQFAADSAEWLRGFAEHFDEIEVAGVPGNHPRRTRKPSAKRAANNDDWLAYQMIRIMLAGDSRFEFNFPAASYATTTVAERWKCLLMHGDGIRSSMPGVPWGGVVRRITTLEQQFAKAKQPLDYVALGHFHTANALDGVGVRTFLNGSVKGLDEYSLKAFGSGRAPSQLMLTFHKRRGVTDISLIDLEDQLPAGETA